MGHPINHSRSPILHGYWLKRYGIAGSYEKLDIAPTEVTAFLTGFREAGWIGGNVTIPHKSAVMPFLDRIDPAAAAMGAVNTIYWDGDVLAGDNADALGFMRNLNDRAPGWDKGARRAVVLGAGGAARAAVYGLIGRGLEVAIVNRTVAKAETLAKHLGACASAYGVDALPGLLADADLLVNVTSLGMVNQQPQVVDLASLQAGATVCDVVYVPMETALLRDARLRGYRTVDGLGMLLHQAVVGFSRWFGVTPEVTAELRALVEDDITGKTRTA